MKYRIAAAERVASDLRAMRARDRAIVRAAIQRFLSFEPTRESQSRIKCLRDCESPAYRLRVGNFRVFYDVDDAEVLVVAVRPKLDADRWLTEFGVR